jgi:hypothetical protein
MVYRLDALKGCLWKNWGDGTTSHRLVDRQFGPYRLGSTPKEALSQ